MAEHLLNNPYELLRWQIVCTESLVENIDESIKRKQGIYTDYDLIVMKTRLSKYNKDIIRMKEDMPECLI